MWSLSSSDAISAIIKEKYKQQRHNDDENQPLSVQPWGVDGDKRRYFLVQGLDDTGFRVYREGSRYTRNAHWWSVAGSIDEVKELATKLEELDRSQAARRLAGRILNAIPMFEATEEVSSEKKNDYKIRHSYTNTITEAAPTRIPSNATCAVYSPRTWLLPLRRSHAWQAHAIHLRRRRCVLLRCDVDTAICQTVCAQHTVRGRTNSDRKWPSGQSTEDG